MAAGRRSLICLDCGRYFLIEIWCKAKSDCNSDAQFTGHCGNDCRIWQKNFPLDKKKKKVNENIKDILQLSYHPPSQSHRASALSGWEGASRISEPPGTESSSPEHPHNWNWLPLQVPNAASSAPWPSSPPPPCCGSTSHLPASSFSLSWSP